MKRAMDYLAPGELPIYDKPEGHTAFVVGEEGQNILAVTKTARVIFPRWPIAVEVALDKRMTDDQLEHKAAAMCVLIAQRLTVRIQATVEAALAEYPETEINNGLDYTLLTVVSQVPTVFFGEEDGELKLGIETVVGVGAIEDETHRTRVAQLPAETAWTDAFQVSWRGRADWRIDERPGGRRTTFAEDLQKVARAGLFG